MVYTSLNRPSHEKTCFSYYVHTKAQISLCLRYIDGTNPLHSKSEFSIFLVMFCVCTARFVSDLVGNTEDRFSHEAARNYVYTVHVTNQNNRKVRTVIGVFGVYVKCQDIMRPIEG